VISVVTIYFCYITYGILQEEIYSHKYEDGTKFNFSLFLVMFQSVVNAIFALLVMPFTTQTPNKVPHTLFAKIGLSYIGAMFASNYALNFVSYPTQVLGKSCKLIPVMIMRIFVLRHRPPLNELVNMVTLTIGISVFTFYQGAAKKSGGDSFYGLAFLLLSLILDGYTAPTQEKLMEENKCSNETMQFWLNAYAVLLSLSVLIPSGELQTAIQFLVAHPSIIRNLLIYSLLSALGQSAILFCLRCFGSLTLTVVTTTRKFFTILASVLWFANPLAAMQWIGAGFVFLGLGMEIYEKYQKRRRVHLVSHQHQHRH